MGCGILKVTRILVWLGVLLGIVPITLLLGVGSPVVGLGLLVIVVLLTYFLITHPLQRQKDCLQRVRARKPRVS